MILATNPSYQMGVSQVGRRGIGGKAQSVTDRWVRASRGGFNLSGSDRVGGSGPLGNKDFDLF
jgi:hypothetical protein